MALDDYYSIKFDTSIPNAREEVKPGEAYPRTFTYWLSFTVPESIIKSFIPLSLGLIPE